MSTPYVVSSDLVSAYPAKSLEIAQFIDGYKTTLNMVQNAQTGSYTFALTDFTKLVTLSNASPVAVTLPLESSVAWPTGTQLRLLNQGAGTVTVAGAVGVTINGSPLTLTQYKGANLIKTGTNTWVFIPFASGVGAAVFSDTPTGTYTGYAYKTFTASGTLTVTTAGFADIVLVAGGGGGGRGDSNWNGAGGGAGGSVVANVYLPVGTLTCTIGGGGVGSSTVASITRGNDSKLGPILVAVGGGQGVSGSGTPPIVDIGGCTGGSRISSDAVRDVVLNQGNLGGVGGGSGDSAGGGGGAGAVGNVGVTTTGGAGGAGITTSIAGTTPSGSYVAGTYAFGGGGGGSGSAVAGAGGSGGGGNAAITGTANSGGVNTGGGGGGVRASGGTSGAGGSGLCIVRVAV